MKDYSKVSTEALKETLKDLDDMYFDCLGSCVAGMNIASEEGKEIKQELKKRGEKLYD